nr:MAG TPA: hypothetical protein [Caudoviricetes sp.]
MRDPWIDKNCVQLCCIPLESLRKKFCLFSSEKCGTTQLRSTAGNANFCVNGLTVSLATWRNRRAKSRYAHKNATNEVVPDFCLSQAKNSQTLDFTGGK